MNLAPFSFWVDWSVRAVLKMSASLFKSILNFRVCIFFFIFLRAEKIEFLYIVKFTLKKIINMKMRKRLDQNRLLKHLVQSNIDARVKSQCF